MATISEPLAIAIQHHRAGRLHAAETIYRQILQSDPNHAAALHLLGVLAHQTGQHQAALQYIGRAIELKPDSAEFHNHLAKSYHALRQLPEAIASHRRALELNPAFPVAYNDLGNALLDDGNRAEAIACFRRAVELMPDFAWAHNNLGVALRSQRNLDDALLCFRRALEIKPDFAAAHNNLGLVLMDQGRVDDAISCFRRALESDPRFATAHNSLGNALKNQGSLDQAIASYQQAVAVDPEYAEAHNNLGNALKEQGRLPEAIPCYRQALRLRPDLAAAHSNLIYAELFLPGTDMRALFEGHRHWHETHAAPLAALIPRHANDRSPERRLRLGYVSPDFRDHVVGRNILPLLREHDHRLFDIYCYSDAPRPDALTDRLRSHADAWRDTEALSHAELAQRIVDDQIDLLIDLTLHLDGNRLLTFARKPAPVQITFAGYPGTTGLSAIDYRLTDPYLDPPGLHDNCCSEESIRLPDSFWCYDPLEREPAVSPLPAAAHGHITFGCLNNFCKVNPTVLQLWARVLKAVGRSRLTLLANEGNHRQQTLDLLAREGVASHRVTFLPKRPRPTYLSYYHGIDIGLDTLPYNGHTTSLDSFWMGVPVVTLVGSTVVGRAGLSQLTNLGLPELIASTPEQYIQIAAAFAQDLPRLSRLRATLRERMEASPLMDAPRFARGIEAAYRNLWRHWSTK